MCRNMRSAKSLLLAALCPLIFFAAINAQTQDSSAGAQSLPTPQAKPTPTLESRFFANILSDQRAIWTSPFHLNHGDAKWLAPLGLSTIVLLATDQETGELANNRSRESISRDISLPGSVYSTGGVATLFYLAGRASGNRRARETGLLGGEALIDGGIVFSVFKNITQRPRPTRDGGHGEFFDGGHSFPSGHATSAWALATVIANEYRHRRAVQISAYALATAVSISRYTGRNHFPSDILVGSAIGYGIGRYVYHRHHDPSLDTIGGETKSNGAKSKLIPMFAPQYHGGNRYTRAYGLRLAWDF